MSKLSDFGYTLESRLKGTVAFNIPKEKVPEHLIKFADYEGSNEFVAVIRRLPENFRVAVNGNCGGNGRKEIYFREYSDPYTDRGALWIWGGRLPTAFFFLTPRALGLSKDKMFEILDQAEKAVGEST